jgi:hypothetical protein
MGWASIVCESFVNVSLQAVHRDIHRGGERVAQESAPARARRAKEGSGANSIKRGGLAHSHGEGVIEVRLPDKKAQPVEWQSRILRWPVQFQPGPG